MGLMVIVILNILFAALGCYIVISRVNPKVKELVYHTMENKQVSEAFIYLLDVFVIVVTAILALGFLSKIPSSVIPYLTSVGAVFTVIEMLFDYIKWILVVLIGVFAFKFLRRK